MTIKDLSIISNETEQKIIGQIADDQWQLVLPIEVTHAPMSLMVAVRFHIWDSAWIPDGLAGKTLQEIGDAHDHLLQLTSKDLKANFAKYNRLAISAVRGLDDLDRTVHLSYGDFSARDYLQHNINARLFWAYDMAKLIGADFNLPNDVARALIKEFAPAAEGYRQRGLFPPEVKVPANASPLAKLLALAGRT